MRKYSKVIFAFLLIQIAGTLCYSQTLDEKNKGAAENEISANARNGIVYNDSAMSIYMENFNSVDSLYKCIELLDKALSYDSTSVIFNNNKLSVLCDLDGHFNEKMEMLDKMIELTSASFFKLSRINLAASNDKTINSTELYSNLLNEYDSLIADHPDSIDVLVNRLLVMLLVKDITVVKNEYYILKDKFPNDPNIVSFEFYMMDFNREDFISSLCK